MKILFVSQRTCVRSLKQLSALSHNNEIHVVTKRIPSGIKYSTVTYYDGSQEQLRKALRLYNFVDLVYCATEPPWTVFVIKEVLSKKSLVLDIHDAMIWRSIELKHRSAEERLAYRWADGYVVPSNTCRNILKKYHKVEKPIIVLPPYVNEHHYQSRSWGWKGGIVYQGRIDLPSQHSFMDYCKYENLSIQLNKANIPFHLYIPGKVQALKPWYDIYKPLAEVHSPLPYEQMLSAMGFHDWGLCGNITPYREWELAMPNKLFDYLAGGIPIIAFNCGEVGRFVEKYNVGISVKSIQEIKDKWDKREECQRNVFKKRYQFTMEKHIGKVEQLFKRVLE